MKKFTIRMNKATKQIQHIATELENRYNICVLNDEQLYKGMGLVDCSCVGDMNMRINMRIDYANDKTMFGMFSRNANIMDFVNIIRALYHEEQHIVQSINKLYSHDEDAVQMAMKNFACEGNLNYYSGSNARYNNDLAEIDAERAGVLKTYQFLKDNVTDEHAEELVCDMVNEKITHSDYFIDGHFDSITDIKDAFDKQYERAKFYQISHFLIHLRPSQLVDQSSDEYIKYVQTVVKNDESQMPIMEALWDEHDVFERDRMVAAITHYLHPEIDYKRLYPCLTNEDLSPEAVFGRSLPSAPGVQYFDPEVKQLKLTPICKPYDTELLIARIRKADQLHEMYTNSKTAEDTKAIQSETLNDSFVRTEQYDKNDMQFN